MFGSCSVSHFLQRSIVRLEHVAHRHHSLALSRSPFLLFTRFCAKCRLLAPKVFLLLFFLCFFFLDRRDEREKERCSDAEVMNLTRPVPFLSAVDEDQRGRPVCGTGDE